MTGAAVDVTVERLEAPTGAELDAVHALESAAFSGAWTRETLATMMTSPISRLYVARHRMHGIVAFCAAWHIGDELHINSVVVDPRMRRQGVASQLLRYVLETSGDARATLEVRESNHPARALYERLGFATTAVRQRYYQDPEEDGLILWRNPRG